MHFASLEQTEPRRTGHGNSFYDLLSEQTGAPNFVLHYFEIPPGGATGYGHHSHEHEIFVVKGEAVVRGRTRAGEPVERGVEPGDAIYVAPNEEHQFCNETDEPVGFICVVPRGAE